MLKWQLLPAAVYFVITVIGSEVKPTPNPICPLLVTIKDPDRLYIFLPVFLLFISKWFLCPVYLIQSQLQIRFFTPAEHP